MRRRRFNPTVTNLEPRAMLDGSYYGYALAYGPPPEVQPAPPGGVLGGPDLTSGGDGSGYYPSYPAGGDLPAPPAGGDPSLIGLYPAYDAELAGGAAGALIGGIATTGAGSEAEAGPVYSAPFDAYA